MTKKWPNTRFSLLLLLVFLSGCPAPIKEDVQYKYSFSKEKPLIYDLTMDVDANANAVIFQYNGKISMKAMIQLDLLEEKTPYGAQLRMQMKDLEVQSDDPRIRAGLMMGMNYFRNYFSHLYITPTGAMTVLYFQKPQPEFSTYAALLFPDFTDMDTVWKGYSQSTNFLIKMSEQKMFLTFSQDQSPARIKDKDLVVFRQLTVRMYDAIDHEKSVEPKALAEIKVDMSILFDTIRQSIRLEDIDLDMSLSYPMSSGIISQNITGSATGKILIKKREEASL